ncbi:NUDIX hydrolase [Paenibacillus protaetiae]|uniref:NUDIX domain-containing protein n=1 Tax=Paenibacillus protaetiae TaxID=2509456 RepID=A0A4P6EYE0_9BACL|nr:NUDIX domain-containing protein [Paenibacillus protaetiae]QAY66799.1 NUDIX domain-containing protein [Paenibacillus protaetiae]
MNAAIDKLAWIYVKDGKILAVRSKGKELFYIPGGKREQGETDEEALAREVEEELTVRIIPETIKQEITIEAQAHGKPEGVMVKMTCYSADFEGTLTAAAEIEELGWLGYSGRERMSEAGRIVMDKLHEQQRLQR